jgi:hypothetical protein
MVRVEFSLPDDEEKQTVATAEWDGREVIVDAEDEPRRDALVRAFRRTPVVTNDPAYLRIGTSGEVVVQPGDLQWFRVVAQARVPAETGLVPRFVPGAIVSGFDPAAGYRPFREQIELLDERSRR